LTSTLLAVLLLGADGVVVTPQVVVAVAVAFVIINILPDPSAETAEPPATGRDQAPGAEEPGSSSSTNT